jgi:hypothetical protein
MDNLQRAIKLDDCSVTADSIRKDAANFTSVPTPARCIPAEERALPSFFVIGPPRTGSSWLHQVLTPHALLPSPAKETRFFDNHFQRGLNWYLAHYQQPNGGRCMGEVAPTYFASSPARERIAQVAPDAKIVCVFRNPVERIISLYRLKRAYGLIPWTFEEALERDSELIETSKYITNLQLWQRSFGSGKVLAGVYDDLQESPQAFVDQLLDFIGIPRFQLETGQSASVHDSERMTQPRSYFRTRTATIASEWFKSRRLDRLVNAFKRSPLCRLVLGGGQPFRQPPDEVVKRLYQKFVPEVERLETILGRDLSSWKGELRRADEDQKLAVDRE